MVLICFWYFFAFAALLTVAPLDAGKIKRPKKNVSYILGKGGLSGERLLICASHQLAGARRLFFFFSDERECHIKPHAETGQFNAVRLPDIGRIHFRSQPCLPKKDEFQMSASAPPPRPLCRPPFHSFTEWLLAMTAED